MKNRLYKKILVENLTKYESNSRLHSNEQIDQIVRSIQEYGFTNPLLIDENGLVIAGHGRLEAAKRCDLKEVPCIILDDLTDDQKAAYVIADNKLALNATWDFDILRAEFEKLKVADFDLELTGFNLEEIETLFNENNVIEGLCDENATLSEPSERKTQFGDIWFLGDHRLMCGSSTESESVECLLDGQHPNTMITDPPYGVKYDAAWRAQAKKSKKTAREENSSLQNDDQADWYDAYKLFPGSVAYVWHASSFTDVVMDGLRRAGFEIKQQIIWNKNIHALSRSDYHWKHEPCWYACRKMADRNWQGGRAQMTVWDVASVVQEKDKTAHPTQKPVALFERSILHHTNRGEYVYDPFSGSGTLVIACEKTGRRALSMELDPKYCDIIIQRYEKYTGNKAVKKGII